MKFEELQTELDKIFSQAVSDCAESVIKQFQHNIDNADNLYKESIIPPTLYKSGDMRNGFSYTTDGLSATITNSQLYAGIQDAGAKIPVTEKMIKFFWAKWYETGNDVYKNMALTKKDYIEIPARHFLTIDEDSMYREFEQNISKYINLI